MLGGPKNPDYSEEILNGTWLNTRMFGDLKQLALIKPFTQLNLIDHIQNNQDIWTYY